MLDFWNNTVWPFLLVEGNREAIATIIAVLGVLGAIWLYATGRFSALLLKLAGGHGKNESPKAAEKLTVESFLAIQKALKAELESELATAHSEEKAQLQARIDALSERIGNPDAALKDARKRIADLEERLEREGNDIGADRLAEAKASLEVGDFSVADDLFAEIEAREELAVNRAARAAFGRGEVAEAQVRWLDAADHYDRAARLDPRYETLIKAGTFAGLAGRHDAAIVHKEALVEIARRDYGPEAAETATAKNNLANSYHDMGRFAEAEPLYREALEITRAALGATHPDSAIRLNNLAGVLRATGRYEEAEPLFREALEIRRAALGAAHPGTANGLNNLAGLLWATERFEEAEPLFREALEITRAALGATHPDTAIRLNNLAELLRATGRYEEAEPLYREALEITRTTFGSTHPDTARYLNNLAVLLAQTDRYDEALPMMRDAIAIREAALGPAHPNTQSSRASLAAMERDAGSSP
ncbi:MAG: tetratricopeptide repeat protein [Pseudomonadota bacterium]